MDLDLHDFLSSLSKETIKEEKRTPKKKLISKSIENIEYGSPEVNLQALPKTVRTTLDQFAQFFFTKGSEKIIVTGGKSTGKTFLKEQFFYKVDFYSHFVKKNKDKKFSVCYINFSDISNISNHDFRDIVNNLKEVNGVEEENIAFVTESIDVALFVSSYSLSKVILEMDSNIYHHLFNSPDPSRIWSSWSVINTDEIFCTRQDAKDLIKASVAPTMREETGIDILDKDISDFVNFVARSVPDEMKSGNVVLMPFGLWATLFKDCVLSMAYSTDSSKFKHDVPIFKKFFADTFERNKELIQQHSHKEALSVIDIPDLIVKELESSSLLQKGVSSSKKDSSKEKNYTYGNMSTLKDRLSKKIIGQQEAVNNVCNSLMIPAAKLNYENKPLRSFLFLGPTGVGKTQLSLEIANELMTEKLHVVRIDLSEYQEAHEVSKLFGAPPGYVGFENGGRLTEEVKEHPHSVVLLDEVEKAHPKIWDAFLQVLDSGHMTDGLGNEIDFTNTIIVMTSNIGAKEASKTTSGFSTSSYESRQKDQKSIMTKEMEKTFRPEFINRIDEIVFFQELSKTVLSQIVQKEFNIIKEKLNRQNIEILDLDEELIDELLEESDISRYGAREIQRVMYKTIINPIANAIVEDRNVSSIKLTNINGHIAIKKTDSKDKTHD